MAKSKKSPTSSRSSKPSKAPRARKSSKRSPAQRVAAQLATADDAGMGRPRHVNKPGAAAPVRETRMLSDPRLPAVGQVLERTYKGKEYRVTRLDDRFVFEGRDYPSLSKIAREIIGGAQVNGFAFFGLVKKTAATS